MMLGTYIKIVIITISLLLFLKAFSKDKYPYYAYFKVNEGYISVIITDKPKTEKNRSVLVLYKMYNSNEKPDSWKGRYIMSMQTEDHPSSHVVKTLLQINDSSVEYWEERGEEYYDKNRKIKYRGKITRGPIKGTWKAHGKNSLKLILDGKIF